MMFEHEPVNNSTENPTISTDTEPSMYEKLRTSEWFIWVVRVIVAVIVILVIVFGARWIHHRLEDRNKPVNVPTAANQSPSQSTKTSGAGSSGSSSSKSASNSKSSNSNSNTGSSTSKGSSSSTATGPGLKSGNGQQLSNTGPGDVVAIFLSVSFAVAGLHYLLSLRKES